MKKKKDTKLWKDVWKSRYLYLMLLPALVWLLIFCYGPMYGISMAFVNYKAKLGILGSEFVGLKHFRRIFVTVDAYRSILNTLRISLMRILLTFPMPIILAILFTEMPGKRVKKVYQTIYTFPHFLSWVITGVILTNILSSHGPINMFLMNMGMEKINFLGDPAKFRPMLYITDVWKECGWSAIIYMAAIAGIDTTLYEAAEIDGASRLQRIWHITLPGIKSTIVVLFIMRMGSLMGAGFDQIFNLRNDVTRAAGQIIDTYIYDITFAASPDYAFTTAVGLFTSLINFALLMIANKVVAFFNEGEGLYN